MGAPNRPNSGVWVTLVLAQPNGVANVALPLTVP